MTFGAFDTLINGLPTAPKPSLGPVKVCPTPTIDRIMSRLLRMASSGGSYPKVLAVGVEDYYEVIVEMMTIPSYQQDKHTPHPLICGVPIVAIPFLHDPLYKKLQAYAAISGVEITYPGATSAGERAFDVPMAEAVKDNYGWRFTWHPYTGIGDSTLEEVAERWAKTECDSEFQFSGFHTFIPVGQFTVHPTPGSIKSVTISSAGAGYSSPPTVSMSKPGNPKSFTP